MKGLCVSSMKTLSNVNSHSYELKIYLRIEMEKCPITLNKTLMMIKWTNQMGRSVKEQRNQKNIRKKKEQTRQSIRTSTNNKNTFEWHNEPFFVENSHLQAFRWTTPSPCQYSAFEGIVIEMRKLSHYQGRCYWFLLSLIFYYQLLYSSGESTNDE